MEKNVGLSVPVTWEKYPSDRHLDIFCSLSEYNPMLCGTFPIGIDVEGSDLDIIMEVHDFERFETEMRRLYAGFEDFRIKRKKIRNEPVIKVNFTYEGFEYELFGQAQPVEQQYAYLHMIIESKLMEEIPLLKEKVIYLKKQGVKTEPAFCKVLEIEGDPYDGLIEYGKQKGYI
ncbi:DUF4269 domain-containing protein [Ornithinibacillus salinisoli]|uniref:DUF4269 domain-containing protein n=1 Tax=Ornithinibacillus salinisoli TaxID=1848459 RepID=A0ABW4W0X6_9BACI